MLPPIPPKHPLSSPHETCNSQTLSSSLFRTVGCQLWFNHAISPWQLNNIDIYQDPIISPMALKNMHALQEENREKWYVRTICQRGWFRYPNAIGSSIGTHCRQLQVIHQLLQQQLFKSIPGIKIERDSIPEGSPENATSSAVNPFSSLLPSNSRHLPSKWPL